MLGTIALVSRGSYARAGLAAGSRAAFDAPTVRRPGARRRWHWMSGRRSVGLAVAHEPLRAAPCAGHMGPESHVRRPLKWLEGDHPCRRYRGGAAYVELTKALAHFHRPAAQCARRLRRVFPAVGSGDTSAAGCGSAGAGGRPEFAVIESGPFRVPGEGSDDDSTIHR